MRTDADRDHTFECGARDIKPQADFGFVNSPNERTELPRGRQRLSNWAATSGRAGVEAAALAELELRAGRAITDAELTSTKTQLVEFARLLRQWDEQTRAAALSAAHVIATS